MQPVRRALPLRIPLLSAALTLGRVLNDIDRNEGERLLYGKPRHDHFNDEFPMIADTWRKLSLVFLIVVRHQLQGHRLLPLAAGGGCRSREPRI